MQIYLPGHKRVFEKFNVMVTLHLLQSESLLSLDLNKLRKHTKVINTHIHTDLKQISASDVCWCHWFLECLQNMILEIGLKNMGAVL